VNENHVQGRDEPGADGNGNSEMITLAASWMIYGDVPAEEIWVRFGIDRATFGVRLIRALDSDSGDFPNLVAYAERLARLDRRPRTAVRRGR
jgi:hypothetical protein